MRKKPSDSSYWSRFAPPDNLDGIPGNRLHHMDTWVRAGRLPEPPRYEDYPWSTETWSYIIAKLKKKSSSPDESLFFQELEKSLASLEASSRLKEAEVKWEQIEKDRSAAFLSYLRELEEKAVDAKHLIGLLSGLTRKQPVKLFLVMREVSFLAFVHGPWRKYTLDLRKLWRRYQSTLHLLDDRALRPQTRKTLREDLENIFRSLRWEAAAGGFKRTLPELGITVVPTKDLSRQAFWTRPTVALVDYLSPILGSNEGAYAATAHLFHLLFNYPDNPLLIKRRYLHARSKLAPHRPK